MVIAFQKVWLEYGKRYKFSAQINPLGWNYGASNAAVGVWDGGEGQKGIEQASFGSDAYNNNGEVVISISFYNSRDTGWGDVGLYYKNFYSGSTSTLCSFNVAWMCLTEDNDTSLGTRPHFYCSKPEWLSTNYRQSNLISKSSTSEIYRKSKALTVDGAGNLTTLGTIDSREGRLGSVRYTDDEFRALSHTYDTSQGYAYSSSLLIGTPSSVLSISGTDIIEVGKDIAPYLLISSASAKDNNSSSVDDEALFTIYGLRLSSGSYKTSIGYNEVKTTGDLSCKGITATGDLSCKGITATGDLSCKGITATGVTTTSSNFAGLVHNRTDYGTIKAGAGTAGGAHSAALELSESGIVTARIDVTNDGGYAAAKMFLTGKKGQSSPLALGMKSSHGDYSSSIWFNDNLITASSSEKYKSDIQPYTDSALDLVNSSVIYSYKYKHDGDNALTKYGLIIERECPTEIIDNSGDAISLYSMCSILWKAVQELSSHN